jgi:acetoin utilization protein AcuB
MATMLVGERMSKPVLTLDPKLPIQDALNQLRQAKIRRAPVVDQAGHLVGFISESDLLHASPSDATSLSVWELNYLLSKITVESIMTRQVITVIEDTPIEEAARIMADNKIGGLPVVRDGRIVGIITETDLFKIFLELLGAREPGLRVTALMHNLPGELAKISTAIFNAGGNIHGLVTYMAESDAFRHLTMRVEGVSEEGLRKAIEPFTEEITYIKAH